MVAFVSVSKVHTAFVCLSNVHTHTDRGGAVHFRILFRSLQRKGRDDATRNSGLGMRVCKGLRVLKSADAPAFQPKP